MKKIISYIKLKFLNRLQPPGLPIERWRMNEGLLSKAEKKVFLYQSILQKAVLIFIYLIKIPSLLIRLPIYFIIFILELEKIHFSALRKIKKGKNCVLDCQTWLINGNNIYLGNYVKISAFSVIMAGNRSYIKIGTNTIIGPSVLIVSFNHGFSLAEIPIRYQPWKDDITDSIEIGEDVWIGGHVIILPGVKIGYGSIIGAGSIVTRNIPPNTVYFNPREPFFHHRSNNKDYE